MLSRLLPRRQRIVPLSPAEERIHALLRLRRLANGHFQTLARVREVCDRNPGIRAFQMLRQDARFYEDALRRELEMPRFAGPYGSLGDWGENGLAPKIRKMLDDALYYERWYRDREKAVG